MTRIDFVNAATLLKASMEQGVLTFNDSETIAKFLCVYFSGSNNKFNTERFLKAAGLAAIRR